MRKPAYVIVLGVSAVLGIFASVGSVTAAASPPRGILTALEYQTLSRAQAGLMGVVKGTNPDWQAAYAACPDSSATSLLKVEQVDCRVNIAEFKAIFSLLTAVKQEPSCASHPGASALSCLRAAYRNLDTAADQTLIADEQTYRAAAARGFAGTCLYTLATTPARLSSERRFAQLLNEAVAAMRTLNAPELERLAPQLSKATDAVLSSTSPSNLAVCRHQ